MEHDPLERKCFELIPESAAKRRTDCKGTGWKPAWAAQLSDADERGGGARAHGGSVHGPAASKGHEDAGLPAPNPTVKERPSSTERKRQAREAMQRVIREEYVPRVRRCRSGGKRRA